MQNVPPVFLFFIGLLFAGACFCFSALVVNGMGKSGRFMMICATGILAGAWLPFDNIPLIIESIVRGPGLFFLGLLLPAIMPKKLEFTTIKQIIIFILKIPFLPFIWISKLLNVRAERKRIIDDEKRRLKSRKTQTELDIKREKELSKIRLQEAKEQDKLERRRAKLEHELNTKEARTERRLMIAGKALNGAWYLACFPFWLVSCVYKVATKSKIEGRIIREERAPVSKVIVLRIIRVMPFVQNPKVIDTELSRIEEAKYKQIGSENEH